jgi:hypothetical protein
MSQNNGQNRRFTEEGVREEIQRQPHIFTKLAENALTVAESLRECDILGIILTKTLISKRSLWNF